MFGLFKKKWFWIVWLALALTGGVVGYFGSEYQSERIENAELVELQDYYNPDRPRIHGIKDTTLVDEYIKFEKDTNYPKALKFSSETIPINQKLYALDWTSDSLLVLIGRQNSNPTVADPRWTELWVWKNHVKKK
ncbi:hypothetical protein [Owenweeksia hongkongensis]|uniref:hypothetical protein n=1 Tax=Owenweeksia hongkongensis TaxID=253245 RepID=UPI003A95D85D